MNQVSIAASQAQGAPPPMLVQLVPTKPYFDDFCLNVKLMGQSAPELERALGQVFGACDFAFGASQVAGNPSRAQNGWIRRLDIPIGGAGGSIFDRNVLDDAEKNR